MNERYAVVNDGGAAVVFRVADDATLKRKYIERLKPEAVKILHDNETVLAGVNARGAPVYAGKGAAWLKSENRRQYLEGVVLNVHGNTPEGYYNLWRGWGVEAGEGDWSLMRDHMRDVICGGDEAAFQYLLGWVACLVVTISTFSSQSNSRGGSTSICATPFSFLPMKRFLPVIVRMKVRSSRSSQSQC